LSVPPKPPPEVAPPLPAPYLAGVPQLDAKLSRALGDRRLRPTAEQIAAARATVRELRRVIRRAREAWQQEQGVTITPEPPFLPEPGEQAVELDA
jgi:hypothetical protein